MRNNKTLLALSILLGLLTVRGAIAQEVEPEPDTDQIASPSISCGGGGQACCAISTCNSGFSCVSNVCRANTIAGMNFARLSLAGALGHNNRIYVVGGFGGNGEVGPIESYNVVTNHWALRANIPIPRSGHASATGGDGRIYAIGGTTTYGSLPTTTAVQAFSPATNTWITRAKLPIGVVALAAVAAGDGRIYAIGGSTTNGRTNALQIYNPTTNVWVRGPNMPMARSNHAAALGRDGKIYVVGGIGVGFNTFAYNPATKTWTTLSPMPGALFDLAAATGVDGRIYVFGGRNIANVGSSIVQAYNPATNTWTQRAPMPTARLGLAAVAGPDGLIYVMGGTRSFTSVLKTVEAYDPRKNTWRH